MKVITNKSLGDAHIIRHSQVLGQVPSGYRGNSMDRDQDGALFENQPANSAR